MHTNSYSSKELLELIDGVNSIQPYGLTIVDTTGAMNERDILSLFYLIDNNLNGNISLAFHSHNNLQLSFSNAQCLMKVCKRRNLIIDSTVFGMGRGAGNLCTELILQYMNDNYENKYNIIPVLKIIDEQINPIFARTPWGYSVPYYLAANHHCHPNYARYLIDKQTIPVEQIENLLKSIPEEKKTNYDADLIKQLYLDKFSNAIDDTMTVEYIRDVIKDRKLLLLAPGKSLNTEREKITDFIQKENPFIISLNFAPDNYPKDMIFITNIKRFSLIERCNSIMLVSSNIENIPKDAKILNYSSYLNNSKMFDNAALMFLKLLVTLKENGQKVYFAGLDGFSPVQSENYASFELINNSKVNEFDERNEIMSQMLSEYSEFIDINFVTDTMYRYDRNYIKK